MRIRNPDGSIKCSDCGELALNGLRFCKKHLELRRERNKNKRAKRKEAGKCTECGVNEPMQDYKKCEGCYTKIESVREQRTEKRKNSNCCTACGRSKSYVQCWDNRNCAECHLRSKFGWLGAKEEAEKIINEILIKQNYKCAVSGRDLKTNKFHIDHILPRSTNPELLAEPSNWQIIVEDANFFKKDKTTDQLISISADIVRESIRRGLIKIEDLV